MLKCIIFDLDGVIVSTDELHYQAWKRLCDDLDIKFDRKTNDLLRGVSRTDSLKIIFREAGHTVPEELLEPLCDRKNNYYRKLLNSLTPDDILPSVNELLDYLDSVGIKKAIGSSSKNTRTILERIGLIDRFDAIADGNMISKSKPDPEVFLKAAGLVDEKPYNCAVIEDALAGVQAANNAGMMSIGIGNTLQDSDVPDCWINDLSEVIKILKGINDDEAQV